jgi:hypothetical protein
LPRVTRQRETANGAALNITALVFCPGSTPSCQRRREADSSFLTLRRWSGTAGCAMKWQKGNRDRRPCSPTTECQTNLVLSVRSAIFPNGETERQRSVAVGKWPCSRLMLCPGRAKPRGLLLVLGDRRSLAPYCGVLPVRSIAGYCWSWPICGASRPLESLGAPLSLTVSAVCGRRNEWNGNVACEIAVKWSGADAN